MDLIHETLVDLRTDLHIKADSTKKLLWIQEHMKPYLENLDLIINTCANMYVIHGTSKMREDQRRTSLKQRQRLF